MTYILATGLYENIDYITSVNYLTITTTSLFNLIQNNTTSISILNNSSASLLVLINALTNPTTLNANNLNVSQISL